MILQIFVLSLVFASAIALVLSRKTSVKLSRSSWEDLVAKLQPVSNSGITAVAREYLNPVKGQIEAEPAQLWEAIGNAEGLERMRANADVLIALAAYTEQWNRVEGRIVAERMRRDGLALRRAVRRLTLFLYFGIGTRHAAFCIHEAASSYYLMRQRLLALYETSHVSRLPVLMQAV